MKRPYYSNYADQRRNSKKRGIDFQFTYEEWLDWWGDDIINRGKQKGQLVMARHGDTGPYHINNVFKCDCSSNIIFANTKRPLSNESRLKRSVSLTTNWQQRKESEKQ